jgi:hypothetical protein
MSPILVAAAGWVLPGLGYILIGQRWRGIVCGITIIALLLLGLIIGGIRVVEFPGYDNSGRPVMINPAGARVSSGGKWSLWARPIPTISDQAWIVPQLLNGPIAFVAGQQSLSLTRSGTAPKMHGRLDDIGTLYVAVAGVLNLIILIDSAHRATKLQEAK